MLLRVTNLKVTISTSVGHPVHPVDGVSFQVAAGETVGLLGESGAGKTTLARSLLRLLPAGSHVEGEIEFEGVPLLSLAAKSLRTVRGDRMSLIHQDPSALNPVRRVGAQLVDVLRAHRPWNRERCRDEAFSMLQEMDFEHVARIYSAYPHQLSGGERQRIGVAQALICAPALVIADEPTASVDCDTASRILRAFRCRKENFGTSMIFISHDVHVLAQIADTIMVMHAGRIVEWGEAEQVLKQPRHSYTSALLKCSDLTNVDRRHADTKMRLPTIGETIPQIPDKYIEHDLESSITERHLHPKRHTFQSC